MFFSTTLLLESQVLHLLFALISRFFTLFAATQAINRIIFILQVFWPTEEVIVLCSIILAYNYLSVVSTLGLWLLSFLRRICFPGVSVDELLSIECIYPLFNKKLWKKVAHPLASLVEPITIALYTCNIWYPEFLRKISVSWLVSSASFRWIRC